MGYRNWRSWVIHWAQLRCTIFSICWLWVSLHWGTVKPCVHWDLFGCFSCNLIVLHCLRYVELPVPRDCYPEGVTYPLDDTTLINYDTEKFQQCQVRTCWHLSEGGKRTYRSLHTINWSLWSWHQWDEQWAGSLHAALLQQCHRKLHWHSQQCYPTERPRNDWVRVIQIHFCHPRSKIKIYSNRKVILNWTTVFDQINAALSNLK